MSQLVEQYRYTGVGPEFESSNKAPYRVHAPDARDHRQGENII
jgi:hypothetical protein